MNEVEAKSSRRKFLVKIVKAALVTAIYGVVWFLIWLLLSSFLGNFFLQFSALYWILVCASLFFTFAIRISENTIYKYVFIILRSFFLIVYIAYSTNFGVLSMDYAGFTFTVEFIPLLAIMVAINLLSIARGLIQAIEFSAQSPED
jgi:hypothetical protein